MGKTNAKGEIGEAMILADLQRQGHGVAIPFGHDLPFDLIVVRKEDGALEKVQCKYTTSDGRVLIARIMSNSAWVRHRYTKDEVDWIAVYDATTNLCFYLPSAEWDGQVAMNLRLTSTANGQAKGIRFASDFSVVSGRPNDIRRSGSGETLPLPLSLPPE
jgi:PD-(D/E)XK endonuclease